MRGMGAARCQGARQDETSPASPGISRVRQQAQVRPCPGQGRLAAHQQPPALFDEKLPKPSNQRGGSAPSHPPP